MVSLSDALPDTTTGALLDGDVPGGQSAGHMPIDEPAAKLGLSGGGTGAVCEGLSCAP